MPKPELEKKEFDTSYTDQIICPHCGYKFHDSWEYGESGELDCPECEKSLFMEKSVSVYYTTRKI
jgi:DNA-directed RNA polymerase subunit RPC12/RpoP